MDLIIASAVGAFAGLLTSLLLRARRWPRVLANVAVGMAGAALTAWFLAPLAARANPGSMTTPELAGAAFGSVFSLALFTLVWPPRPQKGGKR
jgi:uncharacterized membrane protein YeaQ/YmgE (transglycosylase-associated protein family)